MCVLSPRTCVHAAQAELDSAREALRAAGAILSSAAEADHAAREAHDGALERHRRAADARAQEVRLPGRAGRRRSAASCPRLTLRVLCPFEERRSGS